jgi:hypothetical protein
MHSYLTYSIVVLLGFAMWWLLLLVLRRIGKPESKLLGYLLLGPMHRFFEQRNYSFTRRELFGWLVVALLMLAAPIVTRILER